MVLRPLLLGCLMTCGLAQSVFAQNVTCQAFYVAPQGLPGVDPIFETPS
jgi:hypothetical protein